MKPRSRVYPQEASYPKEDAQFPVWGYGQARMGIDGGHEGVEYDPRDGGQKSAE